MSRHRCRCLGVRLCCSPLGYDFPVLFIPHSFFLAQASWRFLVAHLRFLLSAPNYCAHFIDFFCGICGHHRARQSRIVRQFFFFNNYGRKQDDNSIEILDHLNCLDNMIDVHFTILLSTKTRTIHTTDCAAHFAPFSMRPQFSKVSRRICSLGRLSIGELVHHFSHFRDACDQIK